MREHGREIVTSWKADLEYFYKEAAKIRGLTVVQGGGEHGTGAKDEECFPLYRYREGPDITKINISMAELARRLGQTPQNFAKKLKRETVSTEELMAIGDLLGVKFEQSYTLENGDKISISNES